MDVSAMSTGDLERLLERLDGEERSISLRRRRLHERIDFLRGTAAHDPTAADQLAALEEQEREISASRKELHARIEEARAALTNRRGST